MKDLLYKKDLLPTTIACAAKRDKNSTFNLLIKHNQEMLNYFKKFTKVINNKLESDPNSTFLCSLKIPQTLNSTQQDCDFNSKRSDIKNIKLRKYLNLREEVEFNI